MQAKFLHSINSNDSLLERSILWTVLGRSETYHRDTAVLIIVVRGCTGTIIYLFDKLNEYIADN